MNVFMGKNLFVLHTQYNLILACGIILNEFANDENDLILYPEFSVGMDMKNYLSRMFSNVLYIRDGFESVSSSSFKNEIGLFREYMKFCKSLLYKETYDRIFLTQERAFDCLVWGTCLKHGTDQSIDIEEDCYYSINNKYNLMNKSDYYRTINNKSKTDRFRRFLYGSKYIYEPIYFYGMSSRFDEHYVLYPDSVRKELQHSSLKEIKPQYIINGVSKLYPFKSELDFKHEKYIVFFFDLLERYENINVIQSLFTVVCENVKGEELIILCKYHPREISRFSFESNQIVEVPNHLPAEKLLCDLQGKNVVVIGNATTSIIVANKLGYKTISISKISGIDNECMFQAFQSMGIIVPCAIEEFECILD